ncbi:MAG: uracil-DNA glycosylase [Bacteroidia bacterium]|nr:uracil-DNA glycosylase [Bacteroidia bacterium]
MVKLSPEWKEFLDSEKHKPYWNELKEKVAERRKECNVYPEGTLTFNAFLQCPYHRLSVVILGNEPYPTAGHSNGLAYSSNSERPPAALKNIFEEIFNDYFNGNTGNVNVSQHNDLTQWANQGVLLLNMALTVEEAKPKSHLDMWKPFTENAIKLVNLHKHKLVWMLWGKDAKSYRHLINEDKHLVLESEHPGGAGYKEGSWFGNRHFSKANNHIKKYYFNIKPIINWSVLKNPNNLDREPISVGVNIKPGINSPII